MSGPQYMALSALAFAIMGAFVKVAGAAGIPIMQIIAVRAVISLVLCWLDLRRHRLPLLGHARGWLLLRGVVGFLSLSCVYYALLHLPYAQATVLQYMHPIFTALLAFVFLREIPGRGTVICVLLSLLGLVVLALPSFGQTEAGSLPVWPVIIGLCGALGSGAAYTIVRKLAPTEHASVIVLYFPLVCLPAAVIIGGSDFVWPSATLWCVLLGVGVFTQIGQVALTKAMAKDSASRAASLSYVQIIFAGVLGVLFFSEVPTVYTLGSATLIMVGAAINLRLHPGSSARK